MNRLKFVAVIGSGLAAAALCVGSVAGAAEEAKQPPISGFLARPLKEAQDAMKAMDYNKAIAKASEDDRAMALQMLEHWVQGRRD